MSFRRIVINVLSKKILNSTRESVLRFDFVQETRKEIKRSGNGGKENAVLPGRG